MYEYNVVIQRWVDGDTVDVDIDLAFGVWLNDQRVRSQASTHQSRTRDLEEKKLGLAAKTSVRISVRKASMANWYVKNTIPREFGRILGEIWSITNYADKSLNEYLLDKGHLATEYHGKR